MDPEATKTFHTLKLHTHCGGGAYGDVYFCEDISGRKMAVKIVSKKKLGDSWNQELRGVVNYRKITENAPSLLQIFHVEEDEETFFYTMEAADSASDTEYIPDTLAHRLQSGPLPQADLLRILTGVFQGIKLIHEAGFTHRDIKPDNILFVKGVPKLADIGLFSSLSATMTQLAGTLDFIPPEERSADSPLHTDRKSRQQNDLYAFGKVIYCAVTGMSPQEYPTLPKNLPLTQPLKFFFRLAFSLCSKDPALRLNSMEKLSREFADIERKLLYGESFKDRVSYAVQSTKQGLKGATVSFWRLLKHRWYFILFFILLGGGAAYWIWKPAEPYDITKEKTKQYTHTQQPISMTVPIHWEIINPKFYQELTKEIADNIDPKRFTKKQIAAFKMLLSQKQEAIFCDMTPGFCDNIVIAVYPIPQSNIEKTSADEFRLMLKKEVEEKSGFKTTIFTCQKMTTAGYPAIFVDYSYLPKTRVLGYWIGSGDKTIMITMTAKDSTFLNRKVEFNSVMKTLKIGK